jgi:hypothetical protein
MLAYGVGGRTTWTTYPFRCLLFLTPPILLLAAFPFPFFALKWRHEELATWSLLVLWLGAVVFRVAMPHSNFFDGTRHFMEYIPALCAIAGVGAAWWIRKATALTRRLIGTGVLPATALPAAVAVAGALATVGLLGPVVAYHPYEASYFNGLIGGLGGAQRAGIFQMPATHDNRVNATEGDYWFSSLRDAENLLAGFIEPGATFGLCGPWNAQVASQWPGGKPPPKIVDWHQADYVYSNPRAFCWAELKAKPRTVVAEVRRGGGVIYQILKKQGDGAPRPAAPRPLPVTD